MVRGAECLSCLVLILHAAVCAKAPVCTSPAEPPTVFPVRLRSPEPASPLKSASPLPGSPKIKKRRVVASRQLPASAATESLDGDVGLTEHTTGPTPPRKKTAGSRRLPGEAPSPMAACTGRRAKRAVVGNAENVTAAASSKKRARRQSGVEGGGPNATTGKTTRDRTDSAGRRASANKTAVGRGAGGKKAAAKKSADQRKRDKAVGPVCKACRRECPAPLCPTKPLAQTKQIGLTRLPRAGSPRTEPCRGHCRYAPRHILRPRKA